ncbi:hypothetical protein [Paenibacillus sp. 7516]|uniref:hypothetical protein n=1 Tax=Paenibacillus sp. 7516 TaxID=2022549 RepID=UPI000BA60E32|nr:hypothetical protein [Paenibacillus sp. 7516]PAF31533.1 hypothetical protein CHI14_13570 [Paenibacillus sp. 7516]
MSEPKTPNLGLNKIDRSSPSTTYFDLDKYLDQNWEKVDSFAEQVEEKFEETAAQVNGIQERLDTEKRRSVTLEPGLQIVNAERASAFKLEGIKGRTLVNLLGRDGGFEDATRWNVGLGTRTAANNVITVTGNGTGLNPQITNYNHISALNPKVGDKLFLRVRATHIVGTAKQLQLYLYSNTLNRFTAMNIDNPVNGTTYDMYGVITVTQAIVDGWDTTFGFKLTAEYATYEASNESQVQFSNAAIYKVSDEDKSLTSGQMALKYPYVNSLQPVRNPYAIRYGENLLPPFYEWNQIGTDAKIVSPYHLSVNTANAGGSYTIVKVPCLPNTTYRVKADVITGPPVVIAVETLDGSENLISTKYFMDGPFLTEANASSVRVSIYRIDAGVLEVRNPTLTIGSESRPFQLSVDAMLALQTDLYADPLTGANADEVFEKDGQYFKLAKWKKRLIDGSLSYQLLASLTGIKEVYVAGLTGANIPVPEAIMSKYEGGLLTRLEASKTGPNLFGINTVTGTLYITISAADSGWGDLYTPTPDEIKAYFMGWKMFLGNQGDVSKPYNGESAGKAWCPLDSIYAAGTAATTYVLTVPTSPITTLTYTRYSPWTPYQLIYQLATPTVEPITSEGQLTLIEGNNQIEVGTGIMLREYNSTPENTNPNLNGRREINFTQVSSSLLKTKARDILAIYKNGAQDDRWAIGRNVVDSHGTARANLVKDAFDPSATYTVTYFMLDTSPVAPFVGSVAENEKALLTDMNDIIRQNTAAVSVIETAVKEAVRNMQNKRNVWGPIE